MWGNIALETITQVNFGIGFPNMKSDVLIHLSQWQYWWWFWFSFLWSIYYLLVLRVVRFRTLKFRPRIATTLRPHGKWGDLIVCLIPVSWCANILSNSNFILRMIEWQAESGLFTIRIRGKQWYWVYKFELKTLTDVITTPKNMGSNKWRIVTPGDLQSADDYLHILQLRAQNKWAQHYWSKELAKNNRIKKFHLMSPHEVLSFKFYERYESYLKNSYLANTSLHLNGGTRRDVGENFSVLYDNSHSNILIRSDNKKNFWTLLENMPESNNSFYGGLWGFKNFLAESDFFFFNRKEQHLVRKNVFTIINPELHEFSKSFRTFTDLNESSRWLKRSMGLNAPLKLLKFPISNKVDFDKSADVIELFRFRFNDTEPMIVHKPLPHSTFLTMKQKRYKRRKIIYPRYKFYKEDGSGKPSKSVKYVGRPSLVGNGVIIENDMNATKQYNTLKKKKQRHEGVSVVLSRRMLRTKRTLVLPAHVNLTAITNSYDVIHSWFIPGLGLKMDCIPGRATHHTFHIDNVGFYYGQCAEVCGRFHHHMPIRICALPFEHFLVWWHSFGLPKLLFTPAYKNQQTYYGFRKFVW